MPSLFFFLKRVPIVLENSAKPHPSSPFNIYKAEDDEQLVALIKETIHGCEDSFFLKLCHYGTEDSETQQYFKKMCSEAISEVKA